MSKASRALITPTFRMSYPSLIKPRAYKNKPNGDKNFSLEMIFAPDDLTKFKAPTDEGNFVDVDVRQVLAEIAKEQWPGISLKDEFKQGANWPVHDGDAVSAKREAAGKKGDAYKGNKVIKAKASEAYPPALFYMNGKQRVQIDRANDADLKKAESLFVGGSYAFAEVNIAANETAQGKFLSFYVNRVRFVKTGERLGQQSMMERFDGINGGQSDHDPTDGLDDEIPF